MFNKMLEKAFTRIKPLHPVMIAGMAATAVLLGSAAVEAQDTQPAQQAAVADQPQMVLDATECDFGTKWIDEDMKHDFTVTNKGGAPLVITRVQAGCASCTKVEDYPKRLNPGESGKIKVAMIKDKLSGKFRKYITLYTNDPQAKSQRIALAGELKWYIDVQPQRLIFGQLSADKPDERTLTVKNNTDAPAEVTLATKGKSDQYNVELVEKAPGQEWELRVTTTPPLKPGYVRGNIVLNTSIDKQKTIAIPLYGKVPELVEVMPRLLLFSAQMNSMNQQDEQNRVLRVNNSGKEPIKITEVSVDDPDVKTEIKELSPGKVYTIEMTMPGDYLPPPTGRTVTIRTDSREVPVLTVPMRQPSQESVNRRARVNRQPEQMIGRDAVKFELTTLDGESISKEGLAGSVVVLNFTDIDQRHCQIQMQRMERLRETYEKHPVHFINVLETASGPQEEEEVIQKKIEQLNLETPAAVDNHGNISRFFRVDQYPTAVVLDKEGKVRAVDTGNTPDFDERMQVQLNALILDMSIPNLAQLSTRQRPAPRNRNRTRTRRQRPAMELEGQDVPAFTLETVSGDKVGKEDVEKHAAMVIDFISPNCGYCRKQLPEVEKVRAEYADKGVRFLTVSGTMGKQYELNEVQELMTKLGSNIDLVYDPSNALRPDFKVTSVPTLFVVDRQGKIQQVNIGVPRNVSYSDKLAGQLDEILKKDQAEDAQANAQS